jgi:hypothetical protein
LSFYCPVCNGLQPLHYKCPQCGKETEDCGRFGDFMGPYSPYRPIDDIRRTNGWNDIEQYQCIHVTYCSSCDRNDQAAVHEWGSFPPGK